MPWLASGCYAGSLVLFLVTKYYFEHEFEKILRLDLRCGDCCDHCRGLWFFISGFKKSARFPALKLI